MPNPVYAAFTYSPQQQNVLSRGLELTGRAGSYHIQPGYNIENKTQKPLSVPKQTVEFDKARSVRGRLLPMSDDRVLQ